MHNDNSKGSLRHSGLNKHFCGENHTFEQYIEQTRGMLIQARTDLTPLNLGEIIIANSPFSWKPTGGNVNNGVLLIHGLFDSPFQVRDIGNFFYSQNFLVRSILLPGHGSNPADLLDIDYEEWIRAIEYGITSLSKEVDNIFLAGYSLGGLLSLYYYLYGHEVAKIRGLILFAPALKTRRIIKSFLIKHHEYFGWLFQDAKWFQLSEYLHFTKYNCHALNAGKQASIVMSEVKKALKTKSIDIPIFVTMSTDDETIDDKAIISFFRQQSNPKNKLLIYTNGVEKNDDSGIIIRRSHFPELRILDFSHTCLITSPQNYFLGRQSKCLDLQHYNKMPLIEKDKYYLGAISKKNLKLYKISRLTYNPDFKNLLAILEDFINSI